MNNDLKVAAAYIRVSTDNQTELSPDSQIKVVRQYAKAHGYIIPNEYIFRDDGISGIGEHGSIRRLRVTTVSGAS